MRALLILLLTLSVPSCAMTAHQKRVGYAAGAVISVLGVAALIAARGGCDQDASLIEGTGCLVAAIELNAIGLVLTGAGVATVGGVALSPRSPAEAQRATFGREVVAERAIGSEPEAPSLTELTEHAATAARQHRCSEVIAIAGRVEMIDPTYRYGAFAADAAIAGCL